MRFPEQLPDPRLAVDSALGQAVANMRTDGLGNVERFAASYRSWPDQFGDRLGSALDALRIFIVKAGTGGAMFRSLQAQFLREAGELLADDALLAAAGVYEELSSEWVALAQAAYEEDHAGGLAHVEAVARLETAGVEALAPTP